MNQAAYHLRPTSDLSRFVRPALRAMSCNPEISPIVVEIEILSTLLGL